MSQVTSQSNLGTITDPQAFMRMASALLQELVQKFNGQIEFDTNLATQTVTVGLSSSSTNKVSHNLNRVATNFIIISKSQFCDVILASGQSTDKYIALQASAPSSVVMVIF